MDSQTAAGEKGIINRINTNLQDFWSTLSTSTMMAPMFRVSP